MAETMTLHAAIEQVLLNAGAPLTTRSIADEINAAGLYFRADLAAVPASQVSARIKNYPHLFFRSSGSVDLVGQSSRAVLPQRVQEAASPVQAVVWPTSDDKVDEDVSGYDRIRRTLLREGNFQWAGGVDELVPNQPGLYAIRVSEIDSLPGPFRDHARRRNDRLVYVGKAESSLRQRLVRQELRAIGHGTFFRSIGAVLGYRPTPGSLVERANKRNYTFARADNAAIVDWINSNLEVSWVSLESGIDAIERRLIPDLGPLLNLSNNPRRLRELSELRQACVRWAAQS